MNKMKTLDQMEQDGECGRVSYRCGKCFVLIGGPEGPSFCERCLEILKNRMCKVDIGKEMSVLDLCGKLDLGFYLISHIWHNCNSDYNINTMLAPEQIEEICSDLLHL